MTPFPDPVCELEMYESTASRAWRLAKFEGDTKRGLRFICPGPAFGLDPTLHPEATCTDRGVLDMRHAAPTGVVHCLEDAARACELDGIHTVLVNENTMALLNRAPGWRRGA